MANLLIYCKGSSPELTRVQFKLNQSPSSAGHCCDGPLMFFQRGVRHQWHSRVIKAVFVCIPASISLSLSVFLFIYCLYFTYAHRCGCCERTAPKLRCTRRRAGTWKTQANTLAHIRLQRITRLFLQQKGWCAVKRADVHTVQNLTWTIAAQPSSH